MSRQFLPLASHVRKTERYAAGTTKIVSAMLVSKSADNHARQRRVSFAARFQFESHRKKADDVASDVIKIGRRRMRQASAMASITLCPSPRSTSQNPRSKYCWTPPSLQHHDPHQRLNVQRSSSHRQREDHADQSRRHRKNNQKRIEKGSELRH